MGRLFQDMSMYLSPNTEHCIKRGKSLANFNILILSSLVLGNFPNVISWLNDNIKDLFWIISIHFIVWIILPLGIHIVGDIVKKIYEFISKDYITQLIIGIILLLAVVFTYSQDLAWKISNP